MRSDSVWMAAEEPAGVQGADSRPLKDMLGEHPDTLALHVAAALGLKVFPLVGPTSAAELDVFGRGEKILPARACSCFYRPRCRFATGCLDRIPARRIADAVARWVS